MSDKNRTVVLDVDLDCHRCNKKIRKILCKHQVKWDIKSIAYDDKNKVTLSGPFDPHKLIDKVRSKADMVIKNWVIKEPPKVPTPVDSNPTTKTTKSPTAQQPNSIGSEGLRPCSCGGSCGCGCQPCAYCGCRGVCSGYGGPRRWVCEEETGAGGCSIM